MPLKLEQDFFTNSDVLSVSRALIGKVLYTKFYNTVTAGIIFETEAYCGLTDSACHAYLNKRTERTNVFYKRGGYSYVYLCYGIHNLFNIITGIKNEPKAVLIRSIRPTLGLDKMILRRKLDAKEASRLNLCNGPGKLTQALGIARQHSGIDLGTSKKIWIEDHGLKLTYQSTPRIGIGYAGEDALLPWRFVADSLPTLPNY